jgi:NADH:ubiquinone oxidoreductase subunit F (NADH-binding)
MSVATDTLELPNTAGGAAQPAAAECPTWVIGAPRLLAGLDRHARLDRRAHLDVHGPAVPAELPRLLSELDGAGLTGRGGAGFPLAAKIRALRGHARDVVVNGTESEPASRKDRALLSRSPHLVLDGALALARAVGAPRLTVAVHDRDVAASVRAAAGERPEPTPIRVRTIDGGFVAGEARALLRALDGGPSIPPGRRVHGTSTGRLVLNAETAGQLAVLLRMGRHRYADSGTRDEPGTTLLTVGGAVDRPGVVEIPLGTPLGILLAAAGAAPAQAVVVGGYHGSWLPPLANIRLSRAGVAAAGGSFGAGVLLVVDEATCALGELSRATTWLAGESARQCGPCLFGLPALARDVDALRHGHPSAAEVAFRHARLVDGRGACAHPDGAARFVTSALHVLREETERHLDGGCGRPTLGRLPIGGTR